MEFSQKLQNLRKEKGLTQEELAEKLYVSRTAISKWESGRGYPNIDSLKDIAKFFSVTVDQLLSSEQILTIAEEEKKQNKKRLIALTFAFLDLSVILFTFLPFFADRTNGLVLAVSLLHLKTVGLYLKVSYFVLISLIFVYGIFGLTLQNIQTKFWVKNKNLISLSLWAVLALLLILSLQPYGAVFALIITVVKVFILIKR